MNNMVEVGLILFIQPIAILKVAKLAYSPYVIFIIYFYYINLFVINCIITGLTHLVELHPCRDKGLFIENILELNVISYGSTFIKTKSFFMLLRCGKNYDRLPHPQDYTI